MTVVVGVVGDGEDLGGGVAGFELHDAGLGGFPDVYLLAELECDGSETFGGFAELGLGVAKVDLASASLRVALAGVGDEARDRVLGAGEVAEAESGGEGVQTEGFFQLLEVGGEDDAALALLVLRGGWSGGEGGWWRGKSDWSGRVRSGGEALALRVSFRNVPGRLPIRDRIYLGSSRCG